LFSVKYQSFQLIATVKETYMDDGVFVFMHYRLNKDNEKQPSGKATKGAHI